MDMKKKVIITLVTLILLATAVMAICFLARDSSEELPEYPIVAPPEIDYPEPPEVIDPDPPGQEAPPATQTPPVENLPPDTEPPRVDLENVEFETFPDFVTGIMVRDFTQPYPGGSTWQDDADRWPLDTPIDLGNFAGQPISSIAQVEEMAQFMLDRIQEQGYHPTLNRVGFDYDPNQNLWIFSFWRSFNYGVSVAIDGRSAEVLAVWRD